MFVLCLTSLGASSFCAEFFSPICNSIRPGAHLLFFVFLRLAELDLCFTQLCTRIWSYVESVGCMMGEESVSGQVS